MATPRIKLAPIRTGILISTIEIVRRRQGDGPITVAITEGADHRLTLSAHLGVPVPMGPRVHFLTTMRVDAGRVEIRHGVVASEVSGR